MNHIKRIEAAAEQLQSLRDKATAGETRLRATVVAMIESQAGGLKGWAESIGIRPQYACDIRYGRRKISDALLRKILESR